MEHRSDSDKLLKQMTLRFGDKDYVVPVHRMRKAAEWRQQYFSITKDISTSMILDSIDDRGQMSKSIGNALTAALIQFPEKIPDLVFSYAECLASQREQIEEEAYDEDFSRAFGEIYKVAFQPFLASLGMVLEMQRAQQ